MPIIRHSLCYTTGYRHVPRSTARSKEWQPVELFFECGESSFPGFRLAVGSTLPTAQQGTVDLRSNGSPCPYRPAPLSSSLLPSDPWTRRRYWQSRSGTTERVTHPMLHSADIVDAPLEAVPRLVRRRIQPPFVFRRRMLPVRGCRCALPEATCPNAWDWRGFHVFKFRVNSAPAAPERDRRRMRHRSQEAAGRIS